MKHYFYNNKIVNSIGNIAKIYESRFIALSDEQEFFYAANPTATAQEVKVMKLVIHQPISNAMKRQKLYNTKKCISWREETLTITEASLRWTYYSAEKDYLTANEISTLIEQQKSIIRNELS